MSYDKRTTNQAAFDLAKHGWAFCNKDMLEGKVKQLREIAKSLPAWDQRHEILRRIERALLYLS